MASLFGAWNTFGYGLIRIAGGLLVRVWFRLRVEGCEHLPQGPFVVAANHVSYLDPVVLQAATPQRLVFMMTREWYERPLLRPFFRFMRCIPVEETGRNRAALQLAIDALAAGHAVAIYPEGRVVSGDELGPFHSGVVMVAQRAQVPIVPAAIIGTERSLPKGRALPRPVRVVVRFGAPMHLSGDADARRSAMSEARDRLRAEVERLLGRSSSRISVPSENGA